VPQESKAFLRRKKKSHTSRTEGSCASRISTILEAEKKKEKWSG